MLPSLFCCKILNILALLNSYKLGLNRAGVAIECKNSADEPSSAPVYTIVPISSSSRGILFEMFQGENICAWY